MSSVACPWHDAPPCGGEALWCRVGEEEEEEEEFDNTCALPRYRSQRCGSETKSRYPSCHFGLQPKWLFSVIADTLQRFPLQTPTARQLQKFFQSQRGWSCSFLLCFLHHKAEARSVVLTQINMFIGNLPKLFAYMWRNVEKYCLLLVDLLWPPPTKCEEWFLTAHCRISDVWTSFNNEALKDNMAVFPFPPPMEGRWKCIFRFSWMNPFQRFCKLYWTFVSMQSHFKYIF